MEQTISTIEGDKATQYEALLPQITALIQQETDSIANLGNIIAAVQQQFSWFWIGFYIVRQEELVLGPFQGPLACTRIGKGKGVCGQSWQQAATIVVKDVNQFPGHIACNSLSQSEIVVPIVQQGQVVAVLDVDSSHINHFDATDKKYLEQLATLITFPMP